ncbi:hypothetical protein PYCC9005_003404 [Savitreella phatthalungensis]
MAVAAVVRPTASTSQPKIAAKELAPPIWWSNAIMFLGIHAVAMIALARPPADWRPYVLAYLNWQIATLGITLGYHRLWSHRSYTATFPLRVVLAVSGTLGFQGSIKWWVVRHRLHHRFTDTDSDPYSAERGLIFSHVGWIFRKPRYAKLRYVDQSDLSADPVVRFQHRFFVPLALVLGFVLPAVVGHFWFGSGWQGLLWGGFVARIAVWHCTFLINSLAHYIGDRFYTTDVSARGNLILAILTNGEGFHNYHHAFPCDYRNGIKKYDWDPTKWIISLLHHHTGLVPKVRCIRDSDIERARKRVVKLHSGSPRTDEPDTKRPLPSLNRATAREAYKDRQVIILDGYAVDVEAYAHEHPGGEGIFRAYFGARDASVPFRTLNHHTTHARALMQDMRIAVVTD